MKFINKVILIALFLGTNIPLHLIGSSKPCNTSQPKKEEPIELTNNHKCLLAALRAHTPLINPLLPLITAYVGLGHYKPLQIIDIQANALMEGARIERAGYTGIEVESYRKRQFKVVRLSRRDNKLLVRLFNNCEPSRRLHDRCVEYLIPKNLYDCKCYQEFIYDYGENRFILAKNRSLGARFGYSSDMHVCGKMYPVENVNVRPLDSDAWLVNEHSPFGFNKFFRFVCISPTKIAVYKLEAKDSCPYENNGHPVPIPSPRKPAVQAKKAPPTTIRRSTCKLM